MKSTCFLLLVFIFGVAATTIVASAEQPAATTKDEVVKVPLQQIRAFRMPGTIDIKRTTPVDQRPLFNAIRTSLSSYPKEGSKANPAFAVAGNDADSLAAAKEILADANRPRTSFRTSDEVSVVFFSHLSPFYVHLDSVDRCGSEIRVRYRWVPHEQTNLTEHFAIIPLGKLTSGKYRINIVQAPMEPALIAQGYRPPPRDRDESTICKSSEFEVTD